jgi:hypothetical protein
MSRLTPAMDTALAAPRVTVFGALQIDLLDGRTIRLLDGAATLTFNGGTFTGKDATFGSLGGVEAITDGVGDEAPGLAITLFPSSATAAGELSAPGMQGSRVRLWIGAVTVATGAVIADPYLLFDGELDTPELVAGEREFTLELESVSGLERLFDNDEAARLSDTFHQSIWPGENGFMYVTGITRQVIWGPGERPGGITYTARSPWVTPGVATSPGGGGSALESFGGDRDFFRGIKTG